MSEPDKNVEVEEEYHCSNDEEQEENDGYDGENYCEHTFEVDLFDINPERAQEITYCTKCFFIITQ